MKKSLFSLAALATLAACRESNTSVKNAPSAEAITATKALRFDTTFTRSAAHSRAYTYTAAVEIGTGKTVTVPVQIDWTTTTDGGCPQVASLRVYQLGAADPRTTVAVKALRDAACKLGPLPTGPNRAATGAVYLSLRCTAKAVHSFSNFRFMVNALGYHDALETTLLGGVAPQ